MTINVPRQFLIRDDGSGNSAEGEVMVADKECDIVILQGTERLLPIEAKHHFHRDLWTAWKTQLDGLYVRDPATGGLGIYLVFWSGPCKGRGIPAPPKKVSRPSSPNELRLAIQSIIPQSDRQRLRVVVVDISPRQ